MSKEAPESIVIRILIIVIRMIVIQEEVWEFDQEDERKAERSPRIISYINSHRETPGTKKKATKEATKR